ncbi:GntR family transcriptional regulator [Corynebacterium tapiri]|uniref:GntR family transcriptional regulator n=1 Tax=Corynebacterium tapiri TaxID=1448266 RepID=A0A5C4U2K6_9CORY|nr:GntR family transcriptional regulator [Corynebacterium tapiri]TNL95333.1 GntR family transcriptional regulator [Corynebacterium tapiri]
MDNSTEPLFLQVSALIEDSIVDGHLKPGDRAPSTNELADFHSINPATARKGLTILVERGILEKRRGIGMFVAPGAQEIIRQRRREAFGERFLIPLLEEADRLGITRAELTQLLSTTQQNRGL